jgi:hypothetical protein
MSALPAEVRQLSPPRVGVRPARPGSQQRAERRAEQAKARRVRRRWAVCSVAILGGSFIGTVWVLDVLH